MQLYGLAERCEGKIDLEKTIDWEPYRLWASDHFNSSLNRSSMYGVAPILLAKRNQLPSESKNDHIDAIFWCNSSDTFVDIF